MVLYEASQFHCQHSLARLVFIISTFAYRENETETIPEVTEAKFQQVFAA
jgi:hypothetical protein